MQTRIALCVRLMVVVVAGCTDAAHQAPRDAAVGQRPRDQATDSLVDVAVDMGPSTADGRAQLDGGQDAQPDGNGVPDLPLLGVYTVGVDGTNLQLLLDTGTRELSHVRRKAGTDWLTATRYNHDADGNGLAMETEGPGAYYGETEIVVFTRSNPAAATPVCGNVGSSSEPGQQLICANGSWTEDGKLIFIRGTEAGGTGFKRLTFSTLPTVKSEENIVLPDVFTHPADPHQAGPSDASGTFVFSANWTDPTYGLMRPVWKMPASGGTTIGNGTDPHHVVLFGCPRQPNSDSCLGWGFDPANLGSVLGTNDARINHSGTDVIWMQQQPEVAVGNAHPWRQHKRAIDGSQIDLTPPGLHFATTLSYAEWRSDDQQLVYWRIEPVEKVRLSLYTMSPDGSSHKVLPLPEQLCPTHPSYLSDTEIVFTAFRCAERKCW